MFQSPIFLSNMVLRNVRVKDALMAKTGRVTKVHICITNSFRSRPSCKQGAEKEVDHDSVIGSAFSSPLTANRQDGFMSP